MERKILIQRRDNGQGKKIPYPNMWCFPGGSLEKEESYIENVIREAEEEFNVTIAEGDCHFICSYNHDDVIDDHIYVCSIKNQKPKLHEGSSFAFMNMSQIKRLALAWEQDKVLSDLEESLSKKF